MKIKVSIIIPFYSNIEWLEEAVNSVIDQTFKNVEIIIVNDGSPENDTEFLELFGAHIQYYKTVNKGPGHARNYGIDKAKGDYIAFLDSDDLWLPNKLEVQLHKMENNNWVWSHCSYSLFNNKNGELIKDVLVGNYKGDVFLKGFISSPLATPCVMIKKSFFDDNIKARFSEELRYGQDAYLWRIISEKYPLGAINDLLVRVRIRGTNAARRARVQLQFRANTWVEISDRKKGKDDKFSSLPKILLLLFRISFSLNNFVNIVEERYKINSQYVEFLSKVLYIPIYIGFKTYNIILK